MELLVSSRRIVPLLAWKAEQKGIDKSHPEAQCMINKSKLDWFRLLNLQQHVADVNLVNFLFLDIDTQTFGVHFFLSRLDAEYFFYQRGDKQIMWKLSGCRSTDDIDDWSETSNISNHIKYSVHGPHVLINLLVEAHVYLQCSVFILVSPTPGPKFYVIDKVKFLNRWSCTTQIFEVLMMWLFDKHVDRLLII